MQFQSEIQILLDKYRQDTITEEERFFLEKQALDDPFLFDALEGFYHAGEYSQDQRNMNDVKSKMDIGDPKMRSIDSLKRYLAVAASVVILGIISFQIMNREGTSNERLGSTMDEVEMQTSNTPPTSSAPTAVDERPPLKTKSSLSDKKATKVESTKKARTYNENNAYTYEKVANVEGERSVEKKTEVNLLGQVLNLENGAPIQNVTILDYDTQNTFRADENGEFNISYDDDIANLIVKTEGYTQRGMRLKTNVNNKIYLSPEKEIREAVAFDGVPMAEPMLEAMDDVALDAEVMRETKVESYHPSLSYEDLEAWIEKNKNIPLEAFNENFNGDVKINFKIDSKGNLYDFSSEHKSCEACVEEAIRLLSKSGKWKTIPSGLEAEGDYIIKF